MPSGAQRPGCRGGIRYVEGRWWFPYLKIKKKVSWFLNNWFRGFLVFPKYKDSTIHHQLFRKYRGLFKLMFDLMWFTYVLTISGFHRFIKIRPSYFHVSIKTIVKTNCFGPTDKSFSILVPPMDFPNSPNTDRQDFFIDPKNYQPSISCFLVYNYQNHSYFLVEIGPISKMFENF